MSSFLQIIFTSIWRCSLRKVFKKPSRTFKGSPIPLFCQHLVPWSSWTCSSAMTSFLTVQWSLVFSLHFRFPEDGIQTYVPMWLMSSAQCWAHSKCSERICAQTYYLEGATTVRAGNGQSECLLRHLFSLLIPKQYILSI